MPAKKDTTDLGSHDVAPKAIESDEANRAITAIAISVRAATVSPRGVTLCSVGRFDQEKYCF